MLAGHMEEVHRLGEEVVHPRVELHGAPGGEIEQRERLLDGADEFPDRPRVEYKRFGEAGIPAATGVVNQALGDGLGEIDLQRALGGGEFGRAHRGADLRKGEIRGSLAESGQEFAKEAVFGGGGDGEVLGLEFVA